MNQMLSDSTSATTTTETTSPGVPPGVTVEPIRFAKPQRVAFVQSCWHRDIVA